MPYTSITTEGGLLPADILDAIATEELPGQRPEDFGLDRARNLSDRIAAAWQAARGHWLLFKSYAEDLREGESGTSITRQRWVLPLLDVLGYQLTLNRSAYQIEARTYAISHQAGPYEDAPPVHIEGLNTRLDARPPSGRPRLSPHALVQEYLNNTEHLWGIVTNGERLRLLRDSSRFTRPAYVEFDLRAMFEGEKFSEFALFYRLLHRSRLPGTPQRHRDTEGKDSELLRPGAAVEPKDCWLEKYHQQAVETGGRVREKLRDGVEHALKLLGTGLLQHPANAELRAKLERGALSPLDYYRQLLKLIYRLLFLMVAEERGLIATGTRRLAATEDDPFEVSSVQSFDALLSRLVAGPSSSDRLRIYYDHYSVARLRRLAEQPGTGRGPFDDLWMGLQTTFQLLEGSDEQNPRSLGLAPLDGDLFGPEAIRDLEGQRLRNDALLGAIRALSLYREKESKGLRRVNYGALDVEELGSVYESLLDFRPVVVVPQSHKDTAGERNEHLRDLSAAVVHFDLVTGTERKTTGSYYTRPELVQELIKSALVPVIEDRLKAAESAPPRHRDTEGGKKENLRDLSASVVNKEQALLSITVCDPACGSGHFLLAAARRLGRELAKVRSGEDQPTPSEFRRAVRDVIQHCIYGVDLNPLAVDLCKLALWIEGHNAGMPLNFLDHHIKQGNSLIGATRLLIAQGIPDDAYKPVTGDDKKTASDLKKRNKQERERYLLGAQQHTLFDTPSADTGAALAEELRQLDDMRTGTVAEVRAKARRYQQIQGEVASERTRFNLWTAAFFQPLTPASAATIPTTATLAEFERNPRAVRADIVGAANGLAAEASFFHWELEFPQVFSQRTQRDSSTSLRSGRNDDGALRSGRNDGDSNVMASAVEPSQPTQRDSSTPLRSGRNDDGALRSGRNDGDSNVMASAAEPSQHAPRDSSASLRSGRNDGESNVMASAVEPSQRTQGDSSASLRSGRNDDGVLRSGRNDDGVLRSGRNDDASNVMASAVEPSQRTHSAGFDVVLGNPPWEMLQLDPQEFFAGSAPKIANAANMAARNKLIAKLENDNPTLYKEYKAAEFQMEGQQKFVHESGRFPLTSFGRINLMALFAELSRWLKNEQGRAGVILPTGIATDSFNQYFFADLVNRQDIVSLYDFENRERLFPTVDTRYRFSLLTIGTSKQMRLMFFGTNPAHIQDPQRVFSLTTSDIALLNPNTRTAPTFRTQKDAELTKSIYRRIPVLVDEANKRNPWNVRFMLMFMMNTDSGLFRTAPEASHTQGDSSASLRSGRNDDDFTVMASAVEPSHGTQGDSSAPLRSGRNDDEALRSGRNDADSLRSGRHNRDSNVMASAVEPSQGTQRDSSASLRSGRNDGEAPLRSGRNDADAPRSGRNDADSLRSGRNNRDSNVMASAVEPSHGTQGDSSTSLRSGRNDADAPRSGRNDADALRSGRNNRDSNVMASAVEPSQGTQRDSSTSLRSGRNDDEAALLPLYEAKLLHQFTHRWATYEGDSSRDMTSAELRDPTAAITPRYWVERKEVEARLAERGWRRGWLMGFRDIARSTDERTAIFSLLPRVAVGNKIPVVFPADANALLTSCLLATVDSLTFDFVTRQKVGGTSLNFFIVYQLPVLPPDAFSADDIAFIVPRVLELVYTAWDIKAFAEDVWAESDEAMRARILEQRMANYRDTAAQSTEDIQTLCLSASVVKSEPPPPFIWHDERRALIRAELDARIARLYGLTRDELRYILDPHDVYGPDFPGETFRVLKDKETKQFGEYRTRRLVLEAWDREGR